MEVKKQLEALEKTLIGKLADVSKPEGLNDVKAEFLGKKAVLSRLMGAMKDLPSEERPAFGERINQTKRRFAALIDEKRAELDAARIEAKLLEERIDVTLPGPDLASGTRHVLNQIVEDIEDLFMGMGYVVKEGPEVECDDYNFERLNIPKHHPARDMQDTFFIDEERLLRTHTSPVQVRTMLEYGGEKPVKIICPGKTYRRDDDDPTHSHQFMQVEGLVVDEDTTMADLKGTLETVAKAMFGANRRIRLRPSYFPFTEPSVEVDVSCAACAGDGCPMCKHTGYIEILGAGMVHNNVLSACGYDPKRYQGFAFGIGIERLAMLKYGIADIRDFYTNDLRFNKQFKRPGGAR